MPPNHHAFYLWVSMIVLTSLEGTCITTKCNIVFGTIPGIYLMIRLDVIKPRNATTKVMDPKFGTLCQYTREFNVHNLDQLCETNACFMYLMLRNNFIPRRYQRKGYRGTLLQWFKSKSFQGQESGKLVVVSGGAGPVIGQIWSVVRGLIYLALRSSKRLRTDLCIKSSDISPFCRDFQTVTELLDVFIKDLRPTFKYSDVNGSGDNVISEEEVDDAPTVPESNVITREWIWHMATALAADLKKKSKKSDASGGSRTDVGISRNMPSSTKTEPGVSPCDL